MGHQEEEIEAPVEAETTEIVEETDKNVEEAQVKEEVEDVDAQAAPKSDDQDVPKKASAKKKGKAGKNKKKKSSKDEEVVKSEAATDEKDDDDDNDEKAAEPVEAESAPTVKVKEEKKGKAKSKKKGKKDKKEDADGGELKSPAEEGVDVETAPKNKKAKGGKKKSKKAKPETGDESETKDKPDKKGAKKQKKKKEKGKAARAPSAQVEDGVEKVATATSLKKKGKKSEDNVEQHLGFAEPEDGKKKKRKSKSPQSLSPRSGKSRSGIELTSTMSIKELSMRQLASFMKSMSRLSMLPTRTVSQFSFSSYFSDEWSDEESEEGDGEKDALASVKPKTKKPKKGKKGKKDVSGDEASTKESQPSIEPEKTKKKSKKGKKAKSVTVEETPKEQIQAPPEEVDIMAEVKRMKALADAKMAGEEIETVTETTTTEKPEKKKKKKKKKAKKAEPKLTPKQRAELAAKMKIEAEEEEKRRAEEEKRRLEEERRAAIEKAKRETFEQQIRVDQLGQQREYLEHLTDYVTKLRQKENTDKEWDLYVSCPRLPNVSQCDQLNTFLHIWELTIQQMTIDEAACKTKDALVLLDDLEDFLDNAKAINHATTDNWLAVRQHFRDNQAKSLDVATYRLLRQIELNLNRIDIPTADYRYHDDNFALSLWLRIQLPTPLPNPRRPPKPQIEIDYPEMTMDVLFPLTVDCDKTCVRAIYKKYDHLSDLCDTFENPTTPKQLDLDLFESTKIEWWEKMKYKFDNRIRPPPPPPIVTETGEEIVEIPPEPVFTRDDEIPAVPYRKLEPTASEIVLDDENRVYVETINSLGTTVAEDVVNLRDHVIIGGVYSLDILKQPPQPQQFVTMEMNLTALYLPKELEYSDLYIEYITPEPFKMPSDPDVEVTAEEIEAEESKRLQEAYDRLIRVRLTLPDHVVFVEQPKIAFWDREIRAWKTDDIYGEAYNEETKQMTFYLCKLGIFGLATRRYIHMPYTSWEIRPKIDGTITFKIEAPVLRIKLKIKDGLVGLKNIKNNPSSRALENIFGQYFKLPKLIRMMQSAGVDLFPAFDAFCYVAGACEKHWPMEKGIYLDMAQLAPCFNFYWSKWNRDMDRRNVAFLMREYNTEKGAKQKNFNTTHVTPLHAIYVDCNETSEAFVTDAIDMKFYSSLYYLIKGTTGIAIRNELQKAAKESIYALYELLLATRILKAKKKLSKKEKARIAAEQAEKLRLQQEAEAAKRAEEERIRLEEEKKAAIEKDKRETIEQQIRIDQLQISRAIIDDIISYNRNIKEESRKQNEWELYVNCRRLPNPTQCDQMNTYLHLWEKVIDETNLDEASRRTDDVLQLLNELDDLIDINQDGGLLENLIWIRLLFRQYQAKSINVATYRMIRDIEKNLNRIDIPTADFRFHNDNLTLCLWLRVQLPAALHNPRRPQRPRIEINFAELKMDVQFPLKITCDKQVIRALYVKYDHLSDLCETFEKPKIPDEIDTDLLDAVKREWWEKLKYKYDNRAIPPPKPPTRSKVDQNEETETIEETEQETIEIFEDRDFGPDDEIPVVPYIKLEPSASEYIVTKEDQLYSETRKKLLKTVEGDVMNLRRFTIIGGVFSLDLLQQPPQPQDFITMEMKLTPLYVPKELKFADFYAKYTPPAAPAPGVRRLPEEIEEEMRKQEEELDKLLLINLTWPDHVIFFELPLVCHWDDNRRVWTKSDVHDIKHNEEKGQLSFRTGRLGIFALAAVRYANLPYQAWEMRPEPDGSISLQITAAILLVEFNIKAGLIALAQLQNSPNNALQDLLGSYFRLPKLMRIMRNAGVDLFPDFDAFSYVEGTCEKHWPMERHLYFNMAQAAISFNFAWSRWNLPAGRRNIVMQMREYNVEKTKQKNHAMLHVTPLRAVHVDCTEVSQTFNEEGVAEMKFYADLYVLIKSTANMSARKKMASTPKELVFALFELLTVTRVLSFS